MAVTNNPECENWEEQKSFNRDVKVNGGSAGGAETTTTMGSLINSAGAATPNNGDFVATAESGGLLKKISWTNVKAFLKTYFDTLYAPVGGAAEYPVYAVLWGEDRLVTAGNAVLLDPAASQWGGFQNYQNTSANGDSASWSFLIDAGTFTVTTRSVTSAASGRVDWYLDGVAIAAGALQDYYSAGATYNVIKTFSMTVGTGGAHVLSYTVNGKNASSTNYFISITKISIK